MCCDVCTHSMLDTMLLNCLIVNAKKFCGINDNSQFAFQQMPLVNWLKLAALSAMVSSPCNGHT